jgi:parvulin-like peptidyl-prolyl isomerase
MHLVPSSITMPLVPQRSRSRWRGPGLSGCAQAALRGWLVAALLVALAGGSTGAQVSAAAPLRRPSLSELFGDEVLARGKGVEVKRSQLEETFTAYKATLAARGQNIPEDKRIGQEAQLLQRLMVTQILTNRATSEDVKAATDMAEKKLKESMDQAVSGEAFARQLKAAGLTIETYRRVVVEESFAQAVVQRELAAKLKVSDEQVRELYDKGTDLLVKLMEGDVAKAEKDASIPATQVARMKEQTENVRKANLARLEQTERVRVAHIYMNLRDRKTDEPLSEEQKKFKRLQLERLRKRALDGEDFTKLVMEYSEDRGLKETKGEYTLTREDQFAPEFKAAAFSLEPGKISDVVTTSAGLHVIKLIEHTPRKKVDYDKVAKDLKEFLTQQEVQRAMPDYFARLTKEAGVEVLDARYRAELAADAASRKP